jgi:hypothetical protein
VSLPRWIDLESAKGDRREDLRDEIERARPTALGQYAAPSLCTERA